MKKTFKTLALVLVLILAFGAISPAMADAAAKEPVSLTWWYRGNGEQADTQIVEDKLNEMLKTYEGLEHVTVNLNSILPADYVTAVSLGQVAGEQMDILNTVSLSLFEQVRNGTFIPLDDLLADRTDLTSELPAWLLDMGKIDGQTYIIPHYQQAANMQYLTFPKEYLEKYGDPDKIQNVLLNLDTTVAEKAAVFEEYVRKVQEGEGKATKYSDGFVNGYNTGYSYSPYYDSVPNTDNMLRVLEGTDKLIFWPFEEGTKESYGVAAKWFNEGIIPKDPTAYSEQFNKKLMLSSDISLASYTDQGVGDGEYAASKFMGSEYDFDIVMFPVRDYYYVPYAWGAGGDGVTASCKHPEEALRFIEAMNTVRGKELYNLIVYGIEGIHYEKIDDNHIKTLGYDGTQGGSDYLYSAHKWIMGNTFNAYYNQAVIESDMDIFREINEGANTVTSAIAGLVFDVADVSSELGQVMAVHREYYETLRDGLKGDAWEAYYDEYKTKIETAGLQKVLDHLQGQLDAFLAAK